MSIHNMEMSIINSNKWNILFSPHYKIVVLHLLNYSESAKGAHQFFKSIYLLFFTDSNEQKNRSASFVLTLARCRC